MPERVSFVLNGATVSAERGANMLVALVQSGATHFRRSLSGEARAPVCGMGICFECRVTLNGDAHVRACMVTVEEGMVVETDA